jgi:hypothetical protein
LTRGSFGSVGNAQGAHGRETRAPTELACGGPTRAARGLAFLQTAVDSLDVPRRAQDVVDVLPFQGAAVHVLVTTRDRDVVRELPRVVFLAADVHLERGGVVFQRVRVRLGRHGGQVFAEAGHILVATK